MIRSKNIFIDKTSTLIVYNFSQIIKHPHKLVLIAESKNLITDTYQRIGEQKSTFRNKGISP
jgi:hypothetical protein